MFICTSKLPVFFFCIGQLFSGVLMRIDRPYQDEYDGFLAMVERQSKIDEERQHRYVYRGEPGPEDRHRYTKDRNGQYYLRCVENNSTSQGKKNNIRCPLRSPHERPGCFLTRDFTNDVTIQGCYDLSRFDRETCSDECIFEVKKHSSQPGGAVQKPAIVGFCCCVTAACNAMAETKMEEAYDKYIADHPHHHKHRNNVPESSFFERFRFL